jgi:hypothetical protein
MSTQKEERRFELVNYNDDNYGGSMSIQARYDKKYRRKEHLTVFKTEEMHI